MKKKLEEYSDDELFYLMREGGEIAERAFAELYARLSPRVYAYCRRFLGDKEDAQDVFQETFIRFYNSAKQERKMTNTPAFILRITRNLCVNSKKRKRHALPFEEYMAIKSDNRNDQDELLNLIKDALELLPDDFREIFILREYDGLSYTQISEVLDESLSTVKVRIHRAKQKIREILHPYLEEMSSLE